MSSRRGLLGCPRRCTGTLALSASIGLDLLPSGLYRRPRSFTGSWDKGSGQSPVDSDELLSTVHYALFTALRSSRALPPIGNWEFLAVFPHPAPKVIIKLSPGVYHSTAGTLK